MPDCEKLNRCGFFLRYAQTHAPACRGFVAHYCQGPKQDQCVRREYQRINGSQPPDNMMPGGQLMRD